MSEWKPIETAPRDGSPILLAWSNSGAITTGQWTIKELGGWNRSEGWAPTVALQNDLKPTHWMELPEPPSA